MIKRRLISLALVLLAIVVLLPIAPLVLLIGFIIARTTRWKSIDRAFVFAYLFLFFEVAGVLALTWVGVRYRNNPLLIDKTYQIQFWWAQSLLDIASRLFNLRFAVSGQELLDGPGFILVSRHTNIADNFFPIVFVAQYRQKPVRYILKQELQVLPTLDIGGNRLPCVFIDRSGRQTEQELKRVEELLLTSEEDESVLIYPEGTRFSPAKRDAIAKKQGMQEQTERWPGLLPPRLGGIKTLLDANDHKDAVFLCHNGFEGTGGFTDLVDGSWLNTHVNIVFWRVPKSEMNEDAEAFIFDQWDRMQATLDDLRDGQENSLS